MAQVETYLGDGLYASHDGIQIILRAPRIGGDHFVALEPEVFNSLLRFAKVPGYEKPAHWFELNRDGFNNGDES